MQVDKYNFEIFAKPFYSGVSRASYGPAIPLYAMKLENYKMNYARRESTNLNMLNMYKF